MDMFLPILQGGLMLTGVLFFISALLGLARFPDSLSRLHALTKADNLGLGFLLAGAALGYLDQPFLVLKMVLIYVTLIVGSAVNGYLIARRLYAERPAEEPSP